MKKSLILILISGVFSFRAVFSQPVYVIDSIAPDLRAGAVAVIRSSQIRYEIISESRSSVQHKMIISLLSEGAEDYLFNALEYDDLKKISDISANAYDRDGKMFWSLAKSSIYDLKRNSGISGMDDVRGKIFWLPSHPYPYTVEFSYKEDRKNPLISELYFYDNNVTSIEKSGIQVIIPEKLSYKFKTKNLSSSTDSLRVRNKTILTWQEENIPAETPRIFEPSAYKTEPAVFFNTDNFVLEGYAGKIDSWQNFGLWDYKLIEGRDILDTPEQQKILSLIQGISDKREKVRILYKYLQDNTRYFSISYGIGGFQPVPANEIAKNGYGDCKALSNYMKAILKTAGIESYYTLVLAGDGNDIEPDFPSQQFNHVILCVPDANDTIWLECTDQKIPFGYLGGFTCDRYVLAITPDGGKLLHTPVYGINDNTTLTYSEIKLESDGDARAKISVKQNGLYYDDMYSASQSKSDEQLEWLADLMGPSTFNLDQINFTFVDDAPSGEASAGVTIRDISARSSDRLFFSPALLNVNGYLYEQPDQFELYISEHFTDSVKIEIPDGYTVEYLPEYTSNSSIFGKCDYSIRSEGNTIYFSRTLEFYQGLYDKENYRAFYDFVNTLASMDRKMVVLKK